MQFRTDRQRVHGLGTSHSGVHHWWSQRLTAIGMLILVPLFLFPFVRALGSDIATVHAIYGSPFNAVIAILTLAVGFLHLQQGVQVVIEDYVHGKAVRTTMLIANVVLCAALAFTGIFAVAKIAFA